MTGGEDVWRRSSDEQLIDAARVLGEYTDDGRAIILAELHRRGLPEPIPEPILDIAASALASPWRRLAAATIDVVMLWGAAIVVLSSYQSVAILYLLALGGIQMALLMQRAQTIGKALLRIRLVDARTGDHPGFVRLVLVRGLLVNALYRIPWVGLAMLIANGVLLFSKGHRTVHDRVANTVVVSVDSQA